MTLATLTGPAPASSKAWEKKDSYNYAEMIAFANREFGKDIPPLPLPPMLMLHRIVDIRDVGGRFDKGYAVAEFDVNRDPWFFPCHFVGNPLMPGALGFDGILQLAGFFLAWIGARGEGMALSFGGGKFRGKITPDSDVVQFRVDVKQRKFPSAISTIKVDGTVTCGDRLIYEMEDFVVGVAAKPGP